MKKAQSFLIKIRNRLLGLDRIISDINTVNDRQLATARDTNSRLEDVNQTFRGLKETVVTRESISIMLDNLYYELSDDQGVVKKPKVYNTQQTIDKLIKGDASLARYGDGEFEIMMGRSIACQEYDKRLARALIKIIKTNNKKVLIGLNYCYWNSLVNFRDFTKYFVRTNIAERRASYEKFIDFNKQYYAAECTLVYTNHSSDFDFDQHYNKIKGIFDNHEVVIISGQSVASNYLLDGTKSVSWIKAPKKNAYKDYEELFKKAGEVNKDKLILISLGPTATVMAYELSLKGFHAIDTGNLFKDYEWFKGDRIKGKKEIAEFFDLGL